MLLVQLTVTSNPIFLECCKPLVRHHQRTTKRDLTRAALRSDSNLKGYKEVILDQSIGESKTQVGLEVLFFCGCFHTSFLSWDGFSQNACRILSWRYDAID